MLNQIRDTLASEEAEYFSITFFVHVVVLCLLSLIVDASIPTKNRIVIQSSPIEEEMIVENTVIIPETYTFNEKISALSDKTIDIEADSSMSISQIDIPSTIEVDVDYETTDYPLQTSILNETLSGVSSNIGSGFSAHTSGGGALDRLTVEIISSGESKPTNVIWLFDASVSLSVQRKLIANRFEKILKELRFANTQYEIKHGIYSFGSSLIRETTTLTNDANILKSTVDNIKIDESGIENTFMAIAEICKRESINKSRLLIIVFTDEVGDDSSLLDVVSNLARSKAATVYTVGNPAPFGKSSTQFKFIDFDPNYDQAEKWVEIHQGPETLYDMILNINSLPIDKETLDSGFGPFALSKLCLDTGGIYFSVHPNRSSTKVDKKNISPLSSYISRFFDHDIMIKYKPDYRSHGIQHKETQSHLTKKALITACSITLDISGEQTLRFKAFDEGTFVNELNEAQKYSAKLEPKINQIYSLLITGESGFNTLEDRWKASYALAMGRILATKCRIESYNAILAEAKTGLKKQDPKSNTWVLMQSKEFKLNNSSLKKSYESSQKYLMFIVNNYPDTPWALIAQEELDTPMGYSWREEYQEPPKPNMGNGGNNNPSDDKLKPKLIPKPQRKIDKI